MTTPQILVVDDSIVVRMLLKKLITTDLETEVVMAQNGEAALEQVSKRIPNLVILDVEMPIMDGMETLKKLRKLYPNLRVLMLSAATEQDTATTIEALALGASGTAIQIVPTTNPQRKLKLGYKMVVWWHVYRGSPN